MLFRGRNGRPQYMQVAEFDVLKGYGRYGPTAISRVALVGGTWCMFGGNSDTVLENTFR